MHPLSSSILKVTIQRRSKRHRRDCRTGAASEMVAPPGQLGMIARLMADAGVNIEVLYSDHANRLILVVDDDVTGGAVSARWRSGGPVAG